MLSDMGFTPAQAKKALSETVSTRLFIIRRILFCAVEGW
jgi:hypothetical protein